MTKQKFKIGDLVRRRKGEWNCEKMVFEETPTFFSSEYGRHGGNVGFVYGFFSDRVNSLVETAWPLEPAPDYPYAIEYFKPIGDEHVTEACHGSELEFLA